MSLNFYLFGFKIVESDLCRCGKEKEDIDHIFQRCELLKNQITKMLKELKKFINSEPLYIIPILITMNTNTIDVISNFIYRNRDKHSVLRLRRISYFVFETFMSYFYN